MTTSQYAPAKGRRLKREQHTGGTLSRTILRPFNSRLSGCLVLRSEACGSRNQPVDLPFGGWRRGRPRLAFPVGC